MPVSFEELMVGAIFSRGKERKEKTCVYDTENRYISPTAYMETDEEVGEIHSSAAGEGQSDVPAVEEEVDTHFICFRSGDDHYMHV